MPLTAEEITKQIDNFLNDVAQKYLASIESSSAIQPAIEHATIKEKFKKIIFAEHKDYTEIVGTLVPTDLTLAAQRLRLLRMGMELETCNKRERRVSLDCFQELSQLLGVTGISKELEHKLAYLAIVYYLANGSKEQEALDYFITVRNTLKEGGFLPFNVLEPSFVKLYYSFCITLSSWRYKNTGVHTAYDDFPFNQRHGNVEFDVAIEEAMIDVPYMTWLDLQDKIAVITTYQMLSAQCYEQEQFCDLVYLKKAFEFATKSVEQAMKLKNLLAMLHKYGESKEGRDKASKEVMASLFPEMAARQAEKEAIRKAGIERAEYLEEWVRISRQQSEEYRRTAEQQAISSINAWATAAKKEANHQSYEKIKLQGAVMAATYVLAPYAAPYVSPVISGIAGSVGASAATSAAIGSTLAPVIARAAVSTTLNAIVNDDYKHLGKDLVKSAAINAVPAGVGLAVNVGETSTKAIEMMKQAAVNMSKGATEAAFNHSNILQGTFISVVSGAASDKIVKALPTEVGHITALDSAISSGMQSTVGSLVKGEGDPVMDGLHKAAETFIVNQIGNSLGAGLQHALPPRNNSAEVVVDKAKENLEKERLLKESKEKVEQEKLRQEMSLQEEKVELINKIKEKLVLLAKTQEFDLFKAVDKVNTTVHSLDRTEFKELAKNFELYSDVEANFAKPEIKQAVFEVPINVDSSEQSGSGRPGGYWIEPEIRNPFSKEAPPSKQTAAQPSEKSVDIDMVDVGGPIIPGSFTSSAGGVVGIGIGTVKLATELLGFGIDIAKFLYKGACHAAKVDLLNNPEYAGILTDEQRNILTQEVAADHAKVHKILDPIVEDPVGTGKSMLHGFMKHHAKQAEENLNKAFSGDDFGAAKQVSEAGIELGAIVSGGYEAAILGAKAARGITRSAVNAGKAASNAVTTVGNVAAKECARNNFGISNKLKSSSFTPTFDQIQSFSVKSVFDGAPYPKEKLLKLVDYLEGRNVHVHGTNGRSKFVSMWDGSSQIYWPENPTVLEVKHELSHYLDFKKLGLEKYMGLSTHERERLVLERLQNNRVWSELNDLEKKSSVAYVEKIKEAELNNTANTMRHTYE